MRPVSPLQGAEMQVYDSFQDAGMQVYNSFSGCRNAGLRLLLRMQKCRFTTPSQGAGITVLSMGDGILTHLPFRSPDPTFISFKPRGSACWVDRYHWVLRAAHPCSVTHGPQREPYA
jgi:hypothetical protein